MMQGSSLCLGHVLVVDDVPEICLLVSDILEDEGYQVTTATNGKEALERIINLPPDVVLLDLNMPIMSGWELQETLRGRGYNIPVVFMTAHPQGSTEASEHHADGYLAKPFEFDVLIQTVARFAAN